MRVEQVKAILVKNLDEYNWSSYNEYAFDEKIIQKDEIL